MRKNNDSQTATPRQRKYGWRHMVRERSWAVLNIIVVATTIWNVSSLGTLKPLPAQAASIGLYDQCSNDDGDGYATGDTGCRWTFGNLQANNSLYHEGDATVQRLWLDGYVPGSTHTITLQYGTTKGGKHAYDFLTSWNWSESWISEADLCQDIDGCATSDASENTLAIPHDPNGSGQFETGTRNFVMRGGDLTGASTPALVSGSYAADSETAITITFDVASSGDMCTTDNKGVTTCSVGLFFGAHIANTTEWQPFDNTTGATSIPGSPYHVALAAMDGSSVGNRDNQMQAGAIFQGNVIIEKQTVPDGSSQSFNFTSQTAALAGSLTDGGQIVAALNQGGYSVTETPTTGWTLTSIICDDTDSTGNINTGVLTLNVAASETVKCVFTNTRDTGSLVLAKSLTGGPNGYTGPFTLHYDCGTGFIGDKVVTAGGSQTVTGIPTGTSCTVSEPNLPTVPLYTFGAPSFTPSATVVIPNGNGSSVTVTTNNTLTRDTGDLKIIKLDQAQQPMSGVDFTVDGTPYSTDGNGEIMVNNLPTGDYTVTEIEPTDYAFTSVSGLNCTNGNPSTATVEKDATTTCTFTNTRDQGTIELQKVWSGIPGSTTLTITDSQQQIVDIQAVVGQNDSTGKTTVDTGTFYMSETGGLSDYTASALVCYDDTNGNSLNDNETPVAVGQGDSVNVGQGQNVVCSYTNTRNTGTVTVHKMVDTDADGTFEGDNTVANNLGFAWGIDAEVPARPMGSSQGLNTGDYTVSENSVSGYHFVGWAYGESNGEFNPCNDANSQLPVPITVVNGQTTDVTFCNARDSGTITVLKNVDENGDGDTTDAGDVVGSTSWTWDILSGAQNSATGSSQKVLSGSHVISEDQQAGYHVTGLVCTDNRQTLSIAVSESATVTVANGSNITCTFTNTKNVTTITLDKTGPATATPGQSFTYSLAWTVAGNTSATNAVITDPLPANTTFVSATNGGTFAAGNVTWNLGTQTPPASGTVSVTVIVNPGLTSSTTLTNTGTFDTDQTPPVNDTVVTTVTVPQVLGVSAEANLGITKSVDQPIANPGDTVTYTIVVSNTGDADATNVVVTDNLPDGFTFVDTGKASKTWSLGTLAAGASETLTYQVKIGGSVTAGEYINRAFVTADFFDPIAAEAVVTVKVPQVLGLATTGAGLKDLVIFFLGIGLLGAGFIGFQQLRRRSATTA